MKNDKDQPKPFAFYCELVHIASGEIIKSEFYKTFPLSGPDIVPGFVWRATPLIVMEAPENKHS